MSSRKEGAIAELVSCYEFCMIILQWISSNPDTSGTEESVHISVRCPYFITCQKLFIGEEEVTEISSFQGCPICYVYVLV